jgi:hypothetical protein
MAIVFYVLQECAFLIPYRGLICAQYGGAISVFLALHFLNLLAGIFVLSRRLFLKDTGRKLAHLEHQLRSRQSISEELTQRIQQER